jgi:hypothetical protein
MTVQTINGKSWSFVFGSIVHSQLHMGYSYLQLVRREGVWASKVEKFYTTKQGHLNDGMSILVSIRQFLIS